MQANANVVGIVLAGGRSTRMGGVDKALIEIAGKPLIGHAIDRLSPQVSRVAINSNSDPVNFARFGLDVIADTLDDFQGPLAGILTGMKWAKQNVPTATQICTVAADTPFFPIDLVSTLVASVADDDGVAIPFSGGNRHPTFGLWSIALLQSLEKFLAEGDVRKVMAFAQRYPLSKPDIPVVEGQPDPFFNINAPEDFETARDLFADANLHGAVQ